MLFTSYVSTMLEKGQSPKSASFATSSTLTSSRKYEHYAYSDALSATELLKDRDVLVEVEQDEAKQIPIGYRQLYSSGIHH